jgi:hypothetical protein
MRKVLAIAAGLALLGCGIAYAGPCLPEGQVTLQGTIVKSSFTENDGSSHNYMAIALDSPVCDANSPMGKDNKKTLLPVDVPAKWLGHHVAVTGHLGDGEDWTITVENIKDVGDPTADTLGKLSCRNIVGKGWDNMPSMSDYVLAQPGADKLKGSGCNIDSLVFAQCFLEPKWSVAKAVSTLLRKAATGKKLPDIPICGA